MPSINLLPENFTIEAYKKREKIAIYVLAVFFLLCSGVVYGLVELDRRSVEKKSQTLDSEVINVKNQIDSEIKKSELLSSDYNKKDIEKLLSEHLYLSKAVIFPQELVTENAYLKGLSLTASDSSLQMEFATKDYDSFLTQIAIIKDSFWIESFELGTVSKDEENGVVSFSVDAVLRKDMLSFHEHYWDFGLGILAGKTSRYVKIDTYSVALRDSVSQADAKENQGQDKKEKVVVSFRGEAYDKDHMNKFENDLKAMDEVEKLTVRRGEVSSLRPGVISFEGSMELEY